MALPKLSGGRTDHLSFGTACLSAWEAEVTCPSFLNGAGGGAPLSASGP